MTQTSILAFENIQPAIGQLQAVVLKAIRENGPVSDVELETITGLKGSTLRPRRIELENKGFITLGVIEKQNNGRMAKKWVVKKNNGVV